MTDRSPRPFREIRLRASRSAAASARRLPAFLHGAPDVESRLRRLRVAIFGTGAVGGSAAQQLARLQPAELWLIDPKRSKDTSPITHDIPASWIGRPKAPAMGRACKRLSPSTRVYAWAGRAEDLPPHALRDVDVAIMATDNLCAEDAIGQRHIHLGRPLVHASVFGPTLTAQVRFFANADGQGPCPVCGFGEMERRQLLDQIRFSCAGDAQAAVARRFTEAPTRSTSSLCTMAASLALHQILRHVLILGQPVADTLVDYCGLTQQIHTSPLVRNPDCPKDHTRFVVSRARAPLRESSLHAVVAALGLSGELETLRFTVDGANWVERGACGCAPEKTVRRFMPAGRRKPPRCPTCGEPVQPQPFHTHERFAAALLGDAMTAPLRRLGMAAPAWVIVRAAKSSILVLNPD